MKSKVIIELEEYVFNVLNEEAIRQNIKFEELAERIINESIDNTK